MVTPSMERCQDEQDAVNAHAIEALVKRMEDNASSIKSLEASDDCLSLEMNDTLLPLVLRFCRALAECDQLEHVKVALESNLMDGSFMEYAFRVAKFPSLKHFHLEHTSRPRTVLPMSCCSSILSKTSLVSLQLTNWEITSDSIAQLGPAVADNLALLKELTLTNCQYRSSSDFLLQKQALASNTHLQSLVLDNTRLPLEFFRQLPAAMAQNHTLTKFTIINASLGASEMSYLLEALTRSDSLQEISIPVMTASWTRLMRGELAAALASGKDRFRKVQLQLQAVPATSLHNPHHNTTSRLEGGIRHERNLVWGIFKEFLASSTALQEVGTSNLTETELSELMDLVHQPGQHRTEACRWKTLRIASDGVFLGTVLKLIRRLNAAQSSTSALQVFLKGTLFLGEELRHNGKEMSQLAEALVNNYLVNELALRTSEYSAPPHAKLTVLRDNEGNETKETAIIRSILDLNQAGRRYILQDSSNKSMGLDVLTAVAHNLDAIFTHLRETPQLCKAHHTTMTSKGSERAPMVVRDRKHPIFSMEQRRRTKQKCSDCLRFRAGGDVITDFLVRCWCSA